jgi:hypothetical protein
MIATYTTADQVRGALAAGLLTSGVLSKFSGDAQASGPRPYDISTVDAGFGLDRLVADICDEALAIARATSAVRRLFGSYQAKGIMAVAVGIMGASLAITAAADLGASAAIRPHYTSVEALPT